MKAILRKKMLTPGITILYMASVFFFSCGKKETIQEPDPVPPEEEPVVDAIPQVDNAVAAFMTKYDVPGISVAITKAGKLVYAKGYGMADKEAGEAVKTTHRFRIASVSKPITSAAVFKLIEQNKLNLEGKIFGEGSILGTTYGTKTYSANMLAIRLKHLLQHTLGGWNNTNSDPAFLHLNYTTDELLNWTIDNRSVSRTPGTYYDYSNIGYILLGKVIEKVTGQSYEAFVQKEVLAPAGVSGMKIGGSTLADRNTNEVKYYGEANTGADPYAYNIPRLAPTGGWIASPTELLKLMVRVDGFNSKPDLLSSNTIVAMTSVPSLSTPSYYACGWQVNSAGNWWHNGSLPGTYSILVRTNGGYNWVVIANKRAAGSYAADFDGIIWKAVNDPATKWPEKDLF